MGKRSSNRPAKRKSTSEGEYALVYSTDPPPEKRCSNCRRTVKECVCTAQELVPSSTIKAALRIERKGRGGKSVTVISQLPAHDTYLKGLLSFLKRSLGAGGTYYISEGQGVIELQGERDSEIIALIENYQHS